MKIVRVNSNAIEFDNGNMITFDHYQDCCESNYADFKQLEERARDIKFVKHLKFEEVDGYGFRFGNGGNKMFFIPCYSEQIGFYLSDVDIYYDGRYVLNVEAEILNDDW